MRVPRKLLLAAWPALTLLAYYLILFTNWGNAYIEHSAPVTIGFDAAVVLGAFSSWEVFRTEKRTPVRAVAAAVGVPLVLFTVATLWVGLKQHLPA
jgi:hypothetical protein